MYRIANRPGAMRYKKVSHICIFPSDGTNRIRFTGQGCKPNLSRSHRHPEDKICFCDGFIILKKTGMSTTQIAACRAVPIARNHLPERGRQGFDRHQNLLAYRVSKNADGRICRPQKYYFAAFSNLRCSTVLQNRSSWGTNSRQISAAVKPPLYSRKPPCMEGTAVTSR